MKTANVTRMVIRRLPGEHYANTKMPRQQLTTNKSATKAKAQAAAELAGFKRNIAKLSKRQLEELHARLKARLGKLALAKLMREARAK
jgi:hypothetical protein